MMPFIGLEHRSDIQNGWWLIQLYWLYFERCIPRVHKTFSFNVVFSSLPHFAVQQKFPFLQGLNLLNFPSTPWSSKMGVVLHDQSLLRTLVKADCSFLAIGYRPTYPLLRLPSSSHTSREDFQYPGKHDIGSLETLLVVVFIVSPAWLSKEQLLLQHFHRALVCWCSLLWRQLKSTLPSAPTWCTCDKIR